MESPEALTARTARHDGLKRTQHRRWRPPPKCHLVFLEQQMAGHYCEIAASVVAVSMQCSSNIPRLSSAAVQFTDLAGQFISNIRSHGVAIRDNTCRRQASPRSPQRLSGPRRAASCGSCVSSFMPQTNQMAPPKSLPWGFLHFPFQVAQLFPVRATAGAISLLYIRLTPSLAPFLSSLKANFEPSVQP